MMFPPLDPAPQDVPVHREPEELPRRNEDLFQFPLDPKPIERLDQDDEPEDQAPPPPPV